MRDEKLEYFVVCQREPFEDIRRYEYKTKNKPNFKKINKITISDIMLLFVVGIGFAIAFKLSNNNFVVSYFVNLPNAFVTYILKYSQFPKMTIESTIYAGITIILLVIIFLNYRKQIQKDNKLGTI